MKETIDLINANIKNLTSLWKTVGSSFDSYYKTPEFEFCEVKNSEWPNRVWFPQNIQQETIAVIKEKLIATTSKITFPIWNIEDQNTPATLDANGFKLKFKQSGMSLKLDKPFYSNKDINIKLVTNSKEAKLWSELFTQSFGYKISSEIIVKTATKIHYYIAYHHEIAIGTAILYKTNNIMGVHSVGIPAQMRRKGYAQQIMKLLINESLKTNSQYITLQASDIGKALYLKLGFKEQFTIKNYIL